MLLENGEYIVEGLLDTTKKRPKETILEIPVVGTINDMDSFLDAGIGTLFLALGDNREREIYFKRARAIGYRLPNLIARNAYIASSASLGEGNQICHRVHIGPLAMVGNGNILNTGSILEHEATISNFSHVASGSVVAGRSHIGSHVFLGASACIRDRVSVGDMNIIGAGSVVVCDIETNGGTFVGVPARPMNK
jgi:sugar O-acyltransferase (sialic acid O-acetyltransferase NeuD family)